MRLSTSLQFLALSAALILPLAGCAEQQADLGARIQQQVRGEMAKAADKLASEPFTLNADGLPAASISADGVLSIDGKPLPLTPQQQALAVQYRQQIQAIASEGMQIGLQGAELGVGAAASALGGVLSGKDAGQIEAEVQDKAAGLKQAAAQLCERLPALMQAGQALAAAVPEFAPYASVTEKSIEDCRKDGQFNLS
ncbi:MAG: hypothetical protein ACI4NW_09600 [Stenotrophomonas sp.]